MAGWVKLEQRKATFKDGAVWKTKVVGFEWFPITDQPALYVCDESAHMWVATTDYHFGKDKPQGVQK